MIKVIVETSGAQRATLFTVDEESNKLLITCEYVGSPEISPGGNRRGDNREKKEGEAVKEDRMDHGLDIIVYENGKCLEEWVEGPHAVVNFTRRTLQPSLLSAAINDYQFGGDPYIVKV